MTKTIMLKVHEIKVEDAPKVKDPKTGKLVDPKPIEISESDLLYNASRYKEPKGPDRPSTYTWKEFKLFKRIDEALLKADNDGGKLVLDDTDFEFLFENLKKTEWNNASKETVEIIIEIIGKFEKANESEEKVEEVKE